MLPEVGKTYDVPDVLGIGLRIDDPHLDAGDVHARVGHRQALHRLVVLIEEVLRKEIVPVGFVIVSADVEFLGLRAALDLNLPALALLL